MSDTATLSKVDIPNFYLYGDGLFRVLHGKAETYNPDSSKWVYSGVFAEYLRKNTKKISASDAEQFISRLHVPQRVTFNASMLLPEEGSDCGPYGLDLGFYYLGNEKLILRQLRKFAKGAFLANEWTLK